MDRLRERVWLPGSFGMEPFLYLLIRRMLPSAFLMFGAVFAFPDVVAPNGGEVTLRDASGIRVDGRLVDWPEVRRIELGIADDRSPTRTAHYGREDATAKVYLTYDAESLYMAAVVDHSGPPAGSTGEGVPSGDAVEIGISSGWEAERTPGWTRRDVILQVFPGEKAKHPVVWLPSRGVAAPGARVVAKGSSRGYLVEVSIPWALFPGIRVGPGRWARFRLAIAEDGSESFSSARPAFLGEGRPAEWPRLRFEGQAVVEAPLGTGMESDVDASEVDEGFDRATLLSQTVLTGRVESADGKPIPGATVWTWPASRVVLSQEDGRFGFEGIQVYDNTRVLAAAEGWGVGVSESGSRGMGIRVVCPSRSDGVWKWGFVLRGLPDRALPRKLAWAWDITVSDPASQNVRTVESVADFQKLCADSDGEGTVLCRLDTSGWADAAASSRSPARWVVFPPSLGGKFTDTVNEYRRSILRLKGSRKELLAMGPVFSELTMDPGCRFLGYNGDLSDMVWVDRTADLSKYGKSFDIGRVVRFVEAELTRGSKSAEACMNRSLPWGGILRLSTRQGEEDGYVSALAVLALSAGWMASPEGPLFFDREGRLPVVGSPLDRAMELMGDFSPGELLRVTLVPDEFKAAARRTPEGEVVVFMVNLSPNRSQAVNLVLGAGRGNLRVEARLDRTASFTLPAGSAAVVRAHTGQGKGSRGRWWGHHQAVKGEGIQELEIQ